MALLSNSLCLNTRGSSYLAASGLRNKHVKFLSSVMLTFGVGYIYQHYYLIDSNGYMWCHV